MKRSLEAVLAPLEAAGHAITQVPIGVFKPLPFPWGFFPFFGIFPETVLGPSMKIAVPPFNGERQYDLVLIGAPVWFLCVAQPIQSFLKTHHAACLNGKPVLAILSCRELWHEGFRDLKDRLEGVGAQLVGKITVKENLSSWMSYLSTPLYLITGLRFFRPPEKESINAARLHSFGERIDGVLVSGEPLSERVFADFNSKKETNKNLALEIAGKASFRLWAKGIQRFAPPQTVRRNLAICGFFLYLLLAIPVLKLMEGLLQALFAILSPKQFQLYKQSLLVGVSKTQA